MKTEAVCERQLWQAAMQPPSDTLCVAAHYPRTHSPTLTRRADHGGAIGVSPAKLVIEAGGAAIGKQVMAW